jgi:hypothetical protein
MKPRKSTSSSFHRVKVIGLAEPEKKMVAALSSGCPPPPLATMIKAW